MHVYKCADVNTCYDLISTSLCVYFLYMQPTYIKSIYKHIFLNTHICIIYRSASYVSRIIHLNSFSCANDNKIIINKIVFDGKRNFTLKTIRLTCRCINNFKFP